MDWRLYHAIYDVSLHHHWVGTLFNAIEKASIPFMVVATVALWFLARPGGDRKWKLAAGSGLGAAAVAVVCNQVIHAIWDRPRPYEMHQISHPWSSATDASFPSDHASASLAIAFAVLAFDPVAGDTATSTDGGATEAACRRRRRPTPGARPSRSRAR